MKRNNPSIPDSFRAPWTWEVAFARVRLFGGGGFAFGVAVETLVTVTFAPR